MLLGVELCEAVTWAMCWFSSLRGGRLEGWMGKAKEDRDLRHGQCRQAGPEKGNGDVYKSQGEVAGRAADGVAVRG